MTHAIELLTVGGRFGVSHTFPWRADLRGARVRRMSMTPDEMRDIIDKLGWSQSMLADVAGRDNSRTRKQARGAEPIDDALAAWLRALGDLLDHPPPRPGKGTHDTRDHLSPARRADPVR